VIGFGLKEARDSVDKVPRPINRGLNREEAEAIRRKFMDAGAIVQIE
jgi:large subunit ribosomal protein L7/L12